MKEEKTGIKRTRGKTEGESRGEQESKKLRKTTVEKGGRRNRSRRSKCHTAERMGENRRWGDFAGIRLPGPGDCELQKAGVPPAGLLHP